MSTAPAAIVCAHPKARQAESVGREYTEVVELRYVPELTQLLAKGTNLRDLLSLLSRAGSLKGMGWAKVVFYPVVASLAPLELANGFFPLSCNLINTLAANGLTAFLAACKNGRLDVAKLLVERGADPLLVDCKHNTALHHAAAGGFVEVVQFLLDNFDIDASKRNGSNCTALMLALANGHFAAAELLVSPTGKGVNFANSNGMTPLMLTAKARKDDILAALLEAGASVLAVNRSEKRASHYARGDARGRLLALEKSALEAGEAPFSAMLNQSTFACAIRAQNLDWMRRHVEARVRPPHGAAINGQTAVEYLLKERAFDCARCLGASEYYDPLVADPSGQTALMRFACKGDLESVGLLLSLPGERVNSTCRNDYTAFWCAVAAGHVDTARLLLVRGADPHYKCKGKPITWTAISIPNHERMLQFLADEAKVDFSERAPGEKPILFIAIERQNARAVAALLNLGLADPRDKSVSRIRPLAFAAMVCPDIEIPQLLLEAGAQIGDAVKLREDGSTKIRHDPSDKVREFLLRVFNTDWVGGRTKPARALENADDPCATKLRKLCPAH